VTTFWKASPLGWSNFAGVNQSEKKLFENYDSKRLLDGIKHYIGLGWKLHSLHSVAEDGSCTCGSDSCDKIGKHPTTAKGMNDATNDPEAVSLMFPEGNLRNIGCHCRGSGFLVVDVDPRHGGFESFDKLEDLLDYPFVQTVEAVTGEYVIDGKSVRGRHLFFAYSGNENLIAKFEKRDNLAGIDIKWNGYVVLPPSRHFSGVAYEWRAGHAPWEIEMAEAPEELLSALRKNGKAAASRAALPNGKLAETVRNAKTTTPYGAAGFQAELANLQSAREGSRNDTLYNVGRHIGQLIAGGQLEGATSIEKVHRTAKSLGLGEDEISGVLYRSGGALEVGVQNPRKPKDLSTSSNTSLETASVLDSTPNDEIESSLSRANIIDWDELFGPEPEPEDWYVSGIICSGRGHSLYSDAGLGKSLLMREIGACLASGKETLGYPARAALRVLYLDYENNPHNDIRSSLVDMGFEASELKNFSVASFPEFDFFDTPKGASQFIELIDELEPNLIIIDTVSRVVQGDENANDTWNRFYQLTGLHIKKRGIAYVRLDHEGKNASAGARGGSAKRGDVDIVWHYTRKNSRFRLTCEKSRGPIENDWVDIERQTEPRLGHRVVGLSGKGGHIDWLSILAKCDEHIQKTSFVINLMKTEHGGIVGKDKAWATYKNRCHELGLTRQALWDAMAEESAK
jgi:hypothetical protein